MHNLLLFIKSFSLIFIVICDIFFYKNQINSVININLQRVNKCFFSLYNYFCYASFLRFNFYLLFNSLFYVETYFCLFFKTNAFLLLKNKKYNF